MLAAYLARLKRRDAPLRYAHTPQTLEALMHYLRFASRILGVPGLATRSGALGDLPAQGQSAYHSFMDTGHPGDLMALLDQLQEEGGHQMPARPGLPTQASHVGHANLLLNVLRGLHENAQRAGDNAHHVARQFTPHLLGPGEHTFTGSSGALLDRVLGRVNATHADRLLQTHDLSELPAMHDQAQAFYGHGPGSHVMHYDDALHAVMQEATSRASQSRRGVL